MVEKSTVQEVIRKEIAIEDDMIDLYTRILKEEPIMKKLNENDKNMVNEIINILLRDTKNHIKTMNDILKAI
ncbi:hypothetical protein KKA15_03775 [Patescibacteria group bacterium]|nr:hypothetical protein [Patescibacteria group bacterium]